MFDDSVLKYWHRLPQRARIAIIGGLAFLVIATTVFSFARGTQVPLFSRALLGDQLADVETHLASWNVPYTATTDNVNVDSKRRNDVLLRLSLAGVPRTHIAGSNETLEKVGALTPQSVLDEQSRDGLAGDLALGLRGITGIEDAQVIIAPARPGYFADQTSHDASASVRLTLEPGTVLSPETVNGIKTFVAAGVAGLDPSHVAVVDDRGVALSGRPAAADDQTVALQNSLQSALDQVLGPGRAIVRAHIDVDRAANVQLETRRTSLGGPIGNANVSEQYQNGKKHYAKTQSQSDGGSDVVQRETQTDAGAPQRVSVAVFLDRSLVSEIPHIRALVESAAGIDYARGDSLTVQPIALAGVPAATSAPNALVPPRATSPMRALLAQFLPALPPTIIALAWIGLLLVLARPIADAVRSIVPEPSPRAAPPPVVNPELPPEAIHLALEGEPPYTAATVIAGLPTATAAAVLELYPTDVRREIIGKLARPRSPLGIDLAGSVGRA